MQVPLPEANAIGRRPQTTECRAGGSQRAIGEPITIMNHSPLEHDVVLAPFTTLGVGGPARDFVRARTVKDLRHWLRWAEHRGEPLHVLGGGSNTLVADGGFDGLVLKIELSGVEIADHDDVSVLTVAAGERWDSVVERSIAADLTGLECLSGIPGLVGATPIQNVGAYGQEVAETLVSVNTLDRRTLERRIFTAEECRFGYRTSRFKSDDRDAFVITSVDFRLQRAKRPEIRYRELQQRLERTVDLELLAPGRQASTAVRDAVLALRRQKSMVVDPADPDSRSAGSFFLNPILDDAQLAELRRRWREHSAVTQEIPVFEEPGGHKVPAAWLVEHAGFRKGLRRGGVGISSHHALALVSHGGSAGEILSLAGEIAAEVKRRFGVTLEREPVLVGEPEA